MAIESLDKICEALNIAIVIKQRVMAEDGGSEKPEDVLEIDLLKNANRLALLELDRAVRKESGSEVRDLKMKKFINDWYEGNMSPGELLDKTLDLYEPTLEEKE